MVENVNYKKLCVRQHKGIWSYPKTIPKERGPLANEILYGICFILFIVNIILDDNSFKIKLMQYCVAITFTIFLQMIYRLVLMCEEFNHLVSRYGGQHMMLLKDTYHFKARVWITLFFGILYLVYYVSTDGLLLGKIRILSLFFIVAIVYFLGKILQLNSGHLNDSLWVAENNGLDYGSGMAYSFFHGYLNLVLPKTGREDKHLEEIMMDYEDKNKIKFAIYKLFILIPKSMKCFVSLKNEYSPSVEESSSLGEKIITVAGVKDRVYKNAVYKIVSEKDNNKSYIYVSAEYASPLRTFTEVFENTGDHSEYYNKHKKDIILQFYLTLGKALENKGLSQYCELIYFEDSYQDNNGKTCYYDVGEILLERLKELKKKKD